MSGKAKFTVFWIIENFNLLPLRDGELLHSPTLFLKHFLNTNWRLLIFLEDNASKNSESLSLRLERCDDGPKDIEVDCLMSYDNTTFTVGKKTSEKDSCFEWSNFIRKSMVKKLSVLVIECQMKTASKDIASADYTEESTHKFLSYFLKSQFIIPELNEETSVAIKRETSATLKALQLYPHQSYVRTRISIEKRILMCDVKDYLGPGKERRQYVQIALTSTTIVLTLFMSEKDNNDLLEIEICLVNKRKSCCMLVCKIDLIDFERRVHITAEEEHLFEDNKTWKFEQPFKWNDLKGKKEPSLRFTLAYSDGRYISDIEWSNEMDDCIGSYNLPNDLSNDFDRFYSENKFCNVTIHTQTTSLHAHKGVLCARSPIFSAMFGSGLKEFDTDTIEIADFDAKTVSQMLSFMYTGRIQEINVESARKLFTAADKYQIVYLKDFCRNILMNNLNLQNVCSVLLLADAHQDKKLLESSIAFVSYHRVDFLQSEEWKELKNTNVCLALDTLTNVCMKLFP